MEIRSETLASLQKLNITAFTDVQRQSIPLILAGRDVLIQSPTGSGKTLAYLIPAVNDLEPQGKGKHFPRVLILCPTRELCIQTSHICRNLLANREGIRTALLTGGYDMNNQIRSFSKGADIVIGTPSRIYDHLRRHTFKTKECRRLIIDEADEMLKMGFVDDIEKITGLLSAHQTVLLSATYPDTVKELVRNYQTDPANVIISEEPLLKQYIDIFAYTVKEHDKIDLLKVLLKDNKDQILLFANTRNTCDFLRDILKKNGYDAASVHSEMDYKERKNIMEDFRRQKIHILCTTDVSGRGIDIPEIKTVIMYDLADTKEQLIHRTGRTARAGNKGRAYLFITPQQKDRYRLSEIFENISFYKFESTLSPRKSSRRKFL